MNEKDNIREWIRLADMDIATARHMFKTYYPKPLEIICFHSQQAAEKMLKAFLISCQAEPPKTHDLRVLCNLCCEIEPSFSSVLKSAVLLTGYGVIPRYPAELGLIESDAEKAITYAEDVILFINSKLK